MSKKNDKGSERAMANINLFFFKPKISVWAFKMNTFKIKPKVKVIENTVLNPSIKFDEFFDKFVKDVGGYGMTQDNENKLYSSVKTMVSESFLLTRNMISEYQNDVDPKQILEMAEGHIQQKIFSAGTTFKRDKITRADPKYVAARAFAIGLKWRQKNTPRQKVPAHTYKQSTLHLVSISNLISSLFKRDWYFKMYFDYNVNKHECKPGIYQDFCCANVFQTNEFFQQNKNALQLQLFIDDFEVCSPIKSKALKYKLCGIYLQIRNIPRKFLSSLSGIHLVALVVVPDMENEYVDLDTVLEPIVREIKKT